MLKNILNYLGIVLIITLLVLVIVIGDPVWIAKNLFSESSLLFLLGMWLVATFSGVYGIYRSVRIDKVVDKRAVVITKICVLYALGFLLLRLYVEISKGILPFM